MRNFLIALAALTLFPVCAFAQSDPGLYNGQIPTATQWNSYFAAKTDYPIQCVTGSFYGNVSGVTGPLTCLPTGSLANVGSAYRWVTPRTLSITGPITWTSPAFDGSTNVSASAVITATGVNPGSYTAANITVGADGRISAASNGAGGGGTVTTTGSPLSGQMAKFSGVTSITSAVAGTDYAAPTSGSSILYGNGAGGFSNATVGAGLNFAGGVLTASGALNVTASPYSAACDGVTNDATAFQSAVTAAGANGAVFVPPGKTCVINTALIISNSNVDFNCTGSTLRILSGVQDVFSVSGNYVSIHNCVIDGNSLGSVGIWMTGSHEWIYKNVVHNMGSHGIAEDGQATTCADNIIKDNQVYSNAAIGISTNHCNAAHVVSNYSESNGLEGITADNQANQMVIANNHVLGNGQTSGTGGIGTDFSVYQIITGNVIGGTANSLPGIAVNNELGNSDHGVISNNTFLANGGGDIKLRTCTGLHTPRSTCTTAGTTIAYNVTGNAMDGSGGSVTLESGTNANIVTGNIISSVAVSDSGTGNHVSNNF